MSVEDEIAQREAELQQTIWYRYERAFPQHPLPMWSWQRDDRTPLVELMEQAIRDKTPLTGNDLLAAQGIAPAPPGAVT